ncbi:MDR family MFS transporter [Oceanobacillus sp. Castelsardo]|uniref:MDR family MFS transporter n=1 Tax=Oceanobacillus sp. Castelsardo TaxID=1851204 RepID=UPI000837F91E|nr:MDR family MFS transporter [Oceanobacillus sp. Castelsardo]
MESNQSVINDRPQYGILAILMIGGFIGFLNNTLLNVALPSIMIDLKVDTSTVQWLTTGFMLVNGLLIPASAFLIQKYSARRLFLVALGLFTVGTIVAGFSPIFPILLLSRMIQASGSAIMMPLIMNVMLTSFPVEKRGTAMGVFGLIFMFAPAIGPTLSGWILEHFHWRMLFHIIWPIAVIVWLTVFLRLKDQKEKTNIKLDLFSFVLSSVGFGGILYGFGSAGSDGWNNPTIYITITIGIGSLVWFILRQFKLEVPMLNFRVFQYPMFSLSSIIMTINTMAMFSGFLLLPIYVQTVLGISALETGLMLLPGAIVNAVMSPVTGRLFDKYGGKYLGIIGLGITAAASFSLSHLTFETSYYYIMGIHALRMIGMSMVMMPVQTNGLNQLPSKYYPHGVAMNNTIMQVSGAIGTALIVTIMAMRETSFATELLSQVVGEPTAALQQQISLEAMQAGINFAFLISGWVALVAMMLAFFMKRATSEKGIDDDVGKKVAEV